MQGEGLTVRRALLATALVASLAIASLASAAEIDRAEYKAQVEPICKTNAKANEAILKPVRKLVKEDKLKPAASRFTQASAALKKTLTQLKAVPQPTADEAKLAKWLGYIKTEADLFAKAAKKLKAGQKGAAQQVVNKLTSTANLANATVLSFEFHYCKLEPSKFT
jgi:hypothetical protein